MAEYFKIDGGIPSPPIALEGSKALRAVKVSLKDISMEECEPSGEVKGSEDGVSEVMLNAD